MSLDQNLNKILIIDFGSQFTQLIARRIRELGIFSEIISHKKIKNKDINYTVKGIILSGGPDSVYEDGAPSLNPIILDIGVPVLGICYGFGLLIKHDAVYIVHSSFNICFLNSLITFDLARLFGDQLSPLPR